MSVPKGSRYTKGFGQMYRSTGRFGAVAGKPLGRSQRGMTHVYNPGTGKYASLGDAIRAVTEAYGVDLTGPDALDRIPFVLEKAAELLEE